MSCFRRITGRDTIDTLYVTTPLISSRDGRSDHPFRLIKVYLSNFRQYYSVIYCPPKEKERGDWKRMENVRVEMKMEMVQSNMNTLPYELFCLFPIFLFQCRVSPVTILFF